MEKCKEGTMARSIVLLGLILFICSCSNPHIRITGNLAEFSTIDETGNLAEILESNNVTAEYILVVAADGTAFFVSSKSISALQITKKNNEFHTLTTTLPPVCNLNNIKEICVYISDFPREDDHTPFSARIAQFEFLGENSRDGHLVRKYKQVKK